MSLIKAYGCGYDFASFYRQLDEKNQVTAILSKLDTDFTLSFYDNADKEELSEFFSVIGYSSVLSDSSFDFTASYDEGIVMSCDKRIETQCPYVDIDRYPKLMELFNFVVTSMLPPERTQTTFLPSYPRWRRAATGSRPAFSTTILCRSMMSRKASTSSLSSMVMTRSTFFCT